MHRLVDFTNGKFGTDKGHYIVMAAATALPVAITLVKVATSYQKRRRLLQLRNQYVEEVKSEVKEFEQTAETQVG